MGYANHVIYMALVQFPPPPHFNYCVYVMIPSQKKLIHEIKKNLYTK